LEVSRTKTIKALAKHLKALDRIRILAFLNHKGLVKIKDNQQDLDNHLVLVNQADLEEILNKTQVDLAEWEWLKIKVQNLHMFLNLKMKLKCSINLQILFQASR
jgi:hypothetical protein